MTVKREFTADWLREHASEPIKAIATEHHVAVRTLRKAYQDAGIEREHLQGKHAAKPHPDREWLAAHRHLSLETAGELCGLSKSTMGTLYHDAGFGPRPTSQPPAVKQPEASQAAGGLTPEAAQAETGQAGPPAAGPEAHRAGPESDSSDV